MKRKRDCSGKEIFSNPCERCLKLKIARCDRILEGCTVCVKAGKRNCEYRFRAKDPHPGTRAVGYSCDGCRSFGTQVTCTRTLPSCSVCKEVGMPCYYNGVLGEAIEHYAERLVVPVAKKEKPGQGVQREPAARRKVKRRPKLKRSKKLEVEHKKPGVGSAVHLYFMSIRHRFPDTESRKEAFFNREKLWEEAPSAEKVKFLYEETCQIKLRRTKKTAEGNLPKRREGLFLFSECYLDWRMSKLAAYKEEDQALVKDLESEAATIWQAMSAKDQKYWHTQEAVRNLHAKAKREQGYGLPHFYTLMKKELKEKAKADQGKGDLNRNMQLLAKQAWSDLKKKKQHRARIHQLECSRLPLTAFRMYLQDISLPLMLCRARKNNKKDLPLFLAVKEMAKKHWRKFTEEEKRPYAEKLLAEKHKEKEIAKALRRKTWEQARDKVKWFLQARKKTEVYKRIIPAKTPFQCFLERKYSKKMQKQTAVIIKACSQWKEMAWGHKLPYYARSINNSVDRLWADSLLVNIPPIFTEATRLTRAKRMYRDDLLKDKKRGDISLTGIHPLWEPLAEEQKTMYFKRVKAEAKIITAQIKRFHNPFWLFKEINKAMVLDSIRRKEEIKEPERPMTAYKYFLQEHDEKIRWDNPQVPYFEIHDFVQRQYQFLSAEEVERYESMAQKEKERWKIQQKEYGQALKKSWDSVPAKVVLDGKVFTRPPFSPSLAYKESLVQDTMDRYPGIKKQDAKIYADIDWGTTCKAHQYHLSKAARKGVQEYLHKVMEYNTENTLKRIWKQFPEKLKKIYEDRAEENAARYRNALDRSTLIFEKIDGEEYLYRTIRKYHRISMDESMRRQAFQKVLSAAELQAERSSAFQAYVAEVSLTKENMKLSDDQCLVQCFQSWEALALEEKKALLQKAKVAKVGLKRPLLTLLHQMDTGPYSPESFQSQLERNISVFGGMGDEEKMALI